VATLEAVFFVYCYILIGYLAKRIFQERIDEQGLVLLSVYIFQPFLTFWGLLQRPIDLDLAIAPLLFLAISIVTIAINFLLARRLFHDPRDRSIFTVSAVIGNTGNLGVPLGLTLFGEASLPYTTIINLANVFLVYTFGAYFYSRGRFDVATSIANTIKLPILWFALLAILLSLLGFQPSPQLDRFLQMGAYSAIVLQLIIFGLYLAKISIDHLDWKLLFWVLMVKFLFIPLLALALLAPLSLDPLAKKILFMELAMPLAVANINLAALYQCKELSVTALVFTTSLLFPLLLPWYMVLLQML